MKNIPLLYDCDPGYDDAIALVLMLSACAAGKLDVRSVTTVAGNQTIDKTFANAKKVLSVLGKRVPLAAGATKPLLRELHTAGDVHGETGLDGPVIPDALWQGYQAESCGAVELMKRAIDAASVPVTMVATGPLTNVALLFTAFPEVKAKIERLSIMGGGIEAGNRSSAGEFNILEDPEAAALVFQSGVPILLSPLDVTHKALILPNEVEYMRTRCGHVGKFIAELVDFGGKHSQQQGFAGTPLHDPCAVAALLRPDLFQTKAYHIDIDTGTSVAAGMTLADRRQWTEAKPNATVCVNIDREGFIKLLFEAAASYGE
jgi:pyrimidine-specific ribonucleoside hydrolase